jgi:Dyp-type peroxidase family
MTRKLDLADIQGNVLCDYGSSFPKARYFFLNIPDDMPGRHFVDVVRRKVTPSISWDASGGYPSDQVVPKPKVAINIAFTFAGLLKLKLPTATLANFPAEFIDGMAKRAEILGDIETSKPENWDPIWVPNKDPRALVHVMIAFSAQADAMPELQQETEWLGRLCAEHDIIILKGHRPNGGTYQEGALLFNLRPDGTPDFAKEHFGYTDGFSKVTFEPTEPNESAVGGGKFTRSGKWEALATGEFLLGYPDEAQEVPVAAMPHAFTRNGTFMAYRKLHQNVGSFRRYIRETGNLYAKIMGGSQQEGSETIKAKMAGRWSDGVPLMVAPTFAEWQKFNALPDSPEKKLAYINFRYHDDPHGLKCPLTAHVRRVNTRDMLDPAGTSVLNNRRRLLRRGIPYGTSSADTTTDDGDHGIIFMAICASLFRQFEFVQQQWLQYGLDANAGNDTCPLLGHHDEDAKFVIASDPASGKPPFICSKLPQFVETRGGDYFFLPSLTALRMIAMGTIDPT